MKRASVIKIYFSKFGFKYKNCSTKGKNFLAMDTFLTDHDYVLDFLKDNPTTPAPHPQTGDQSWPFGDGRYFAIKFKINKIAAKISQTGTFNFCNPSNFFDIS